MQIQGCCTFPHGPRSIYVFIMSISAYIFAISASWGCYFVNVDATFSAKEGSKGQIFTDYSSALGLFSYEDGADESEGNFDWVCYPYNQDQLDQLDGSFMMARFFAMAANILIGVPMVFIFLTCCVEFTRTTMKLLATAMILGACFQILTFLMYRSSICEDYGCSFYIGSALAICTFLVAFTAGLITCCIPESVEPFTSEEKGRSLEPFQPGTVTETETVLPDGSTKITRTTVNLDGSKTIEEDIYDPPVDEDGMGDGGDDNYHDQPGYGRGYEVQ